MKNSNALLLKLAAFLQGENSKLFSEKFSDLPPEKVKNLADRYYNLFRMWSDYDAYRNFISGLESFESAEALLKNLEERTRRISDFLQKLGLNRSGADDVSRQYLHRYFQEAEVDFFERLEGVTSRQEFFEILRSGKKKKKIIPELEGKDLSSLSQEDLLWIEARIFDSKQGGEAHSVDDLISIVKNFRSVGASLGEKLSNFKSYSELSKWLDDQSLDNKQAYLQSIEGPAQADGMSSVIYEDERWKVVLIGSTIAGQWWGRDTDFCISGLSENLYSHYAIKENLDPYFIIDKLANSSDPMRKFTIAMVYKEDGSSELSSLEYTMTDANNHPIDLSEIKKSLKDKYDIIFNEISKNSAKKEASAGKINFQIMMKIINNEDIINIKKYEKEILQNEDLIKNLFSKINIQNIENFKNLIKKYIEKEPLFFLSNFSEKDWAGPYLEIVAKSVIEKNPINFLRKFSEKDWAKSYLGMARKSAAEKDPIGFLLNFSEKDWAKSYLETAAKPYAEKYPIEFINRFSEKNWAGPYLEMARKSAAENTPINFLYYFSEEDWAKSYLETARKSAAEKDPIDFLNNFSEKDWARPYLETAAKPYAEKYPIEFINRFSERYWIRPYLETAAKPYAEKYPIEFINNFSEKDWAGPYLDIVAKSVIEKNPIDFLNRFSEKDWAGPYLGIAAKPYAEEDPINFLRNFSEKDWAKSYLGMARKSAAEKRPTNFLLNFSVEDWAGPYLETARKSAAEKEPFRFLLNFSEKDWAGPYLETARKSYAEKEPIYFLKNFSEKDWAGPYLEIAGKSAAEKNPIDFLKNFSEKDWAGPYLEIAGKSVAENTPINFLKNFSKKDWAQIKRPELGGRSYVDLAEEKQKEIEKTSSYYPKLIKLAKILKNLNLSKESNKVSKLINN